ncbi:protein lin-37 homolog [Drosophila madeirensis]|uniref:Protein lin-37 homolog n=1 Tax=Drosophila madeirensis TaxID=30013 RepID=A0AAU9FP68_DROMD
MSLRKKLPKNAKEQHSPQLTRSSKKQQKNAAADKSKKLLEPPKAQTQGEEKPPKPVGRPAKKLSLDPEKKQQKKPPKAEPQGNGDDDDVPMRSTASKKKLIPKQKSLSTDILVKKEKPKLSSESHAVDLFGRTLDLSKFSESTPLYPICRAWACNQPRNTVAVSTCSTECGKTGKREPNAEEILEQMQSGKLLELTQVPRARSTQLTVVPPALVYTEEEQKADLEQEGAEAEVLLALNVARWKRIRQSWQQNTRKYNQERYEIIDQIVTESMRKIVTESMRKAE